MILKRLLQLIYPEKCVLCRRILKKDELDLCRSCRTDAPEFVHRKRKIRFVKDFTAVWYYEDLVRTSLLRYKFRRATHYAESYGRLAAMAVVRDLPDDLDVVTYVPVSRRRKLERGYDQVELLAKAVSAELGIPMVALLKKVRNNPPQSGLENEAKRRANVLGVYKPINEEMIRGRKVLLLDDIITTGATVSECARVLREAGAEQVYAAAVAAVRNQEQ